MKQFLAGTAIGFFVLAVGGVVLATDYVWDAGASDDYWHTSGNWDGPGCPGGGIPARIGDRAIIDKDVTNSMPVIFSSSSGYSPVPGVNENRAVQDLYLIGDGSGPSNTPSMVALLVTGDTLYVRHVFMISGSDGGQEATIKVTADCAFKPEIMNLKGTTKSRIELIIEEDVFVETETRVTGPVNLDISHGAKYVSNWLIITQGKITRDSTFTFPS